MVHKLKWLEKMSTRIYTLLFTLIFFLVIFVDKRASYANQNNATVPNIILFIIGISLVCLFLVFYYYVLRKYVQKFTTKQSYFILSILNLLFLGLQIYIFFNIYFQSGWDCGTLAEATEGLAYGNYDINEGFFGEYFSRYPNNVWLTFCLTIIKKVSIYIGVTDTYLASVIVGIAGVNISCFLVTLIVKEITGSRDYAVMSYMIICLYIGLSPWCIIPYSDIYAMFYTVTILYLYIRKKHTKHLKMRYFLITILSLMGYMIKPTVIIIYIAILINEFLHITSLKELGRKLCRYILIFIGCIIIMKFSGNYAEQYIGLIPNENREFSIIHYAMMGLNEESTGGFNGDDVEYSASFENSEDRVLGDLKVMKMRIQEKGFWGMLKFETKKLLMNNNDGSFSWAKEGEFFKNIYSVPNTVSSEYLRTFYYAQDNRVLYNIMQMVWLLLLGFSTVAGWCYLKKGGGEENIIFLTLIGMSLFIILFEGRARYLILYSPYYIITSFIGLKYLLKIQVNKIINR